MKQRANSKQKNVHEKQAPNLGPLIAGKILRENAPAKLLTKISAFKTSDFGELVIKTSNTKINGNYIIRNYV